MSRRIAELAKAGDRDTAFLASALTLVRGSALSGTTFVAWFEDYVTALARGAFFPAKNR